MSGVNQYANPMHFKQLNHILMKNHMPTKKVSNPKFGDFCFQKVECHETTNCSYVECYEENVMISSSFFTYFSTCHINNEFWKSSAHTSKFEACTMCRQIFQTLTYQFCSVTQFIRLHAKQRRLQCLFSMDSLLHLSCYHADMTYRWVCLSLWPCGTFF